MDTLFPRRHGTAIKNQAWTGYGVAALLLLSGCLLFVAGVFKAIPEPGRPLLIGAVPALAYEPLNLGHAVGDWPHDVSLLEARSAPALMEAVSAGSLDGGALSMDEVMRLEAAGRPMAVLAILNISRGADVVLARSADTPRAPWPNARVGVEVDGTGAFVLHRFLEHYGVATGSVHIIPVAAGEHATAFTRQRLDFLVSYEPLVSRLEKAGAVRVFDSAAMGNEVMGVLAVRRDRMEGQKGALRSLLQVWYQGLGLLKGGQEVWLDRVAIRHGITQERLRHVLSSLDFPDSANSRNLMLSDVSATESACIWLQQSGEATGDLEPLLDPSYLPQ